jgi:hypothetical protein
MPKHIIVAAALLLSACGGGEGGGNSAGDNGSDDAAGSVVEQTPANLQDDPNNMVVPLTSPSSAQSPAPSPVPGASASPVASLPASFQGRWGMVAKDCDPKLDYAAKGLMVVGADTLKFYESRGRIERAAASRPGTFQLDLAYTGEGQTWSRRETLTLLDDGRTLVREERPAGSFRYTKCPAGRETPVDQRGA